MKLLHEQKDFLERNIQVLSQDHTGKATEVLDMLKSLLETVLYVEQDCKESARANRVRLEFPSPRIKRKRKA